MALLTSGVAMYRQAGMPDEGCAQDASVAFPVAVSAYRHRALWLRQLTTVSTDRRACEDYRRLCAHSARAYHSALAVSQRGP